ncbi:hypothetical protein D3C84_1008090 [compost metagenome]
MLFGQHHHGVKLILAAVLLTQLAPAPPERMFLCFAEVMRTALTGFDLQQASAQGGFRMGQTEALVHDGAAGAKFEGAVDQPFVLFVAISLLNQAPQHR